MTRDLEINNKFTKAVEKNEIFSKKDIHLAIHEHLEYGKHSLLAIMKRVLTDIIPKAYKRYSPNLKNYLRVIK